VSSRLLYLIFLQLLNLLLLLGRSSASKDVELLVLANFSHEIVDTDLPNADDWAASEVLLTNYSRMDSEALLRLRPWEARVFRRTITEATPRR